LAAGRKVMEAISAFFAGKVAWLIGLAGVGGALMLAKRTLPKLAAKWAGKQVSKALASQDKDDRELVLALVRWAEKKIPGPGKGKEKLALVTDKIVSMFPLSDRNKGNVREIIEESVYKMKEELGKYSK